jgi:hypothetical protein
VEIGCTVIRNTEGELIWFNSWKQLWVVLSLLWAISSAGWLWQKENIRAGQEPSRIYDLCVAARGVAQDIFHCEKEFEINFVNTRADAALRFHELLPYLVLIPVIIAWLLGCALLGSGKNSKST